MKLDHLRGIYAVARPEAPSGPWANIDLSEAICLNRESSPTLGIVSLPVSALDKPESREAIREKMDQMGFSAKATVRMTSYRGAHEHTIFQAVINSPGLDVMFRTSHALAKPVTFQETRLQMSSINPATLQIVIPECARSHSLPLASMAQASMVTRALREAVRTFGWPIATQAKIIGSDRRTRGIDGDELLKPDLILAILAYGEHREEMTVERSTGKIRTLPYFNNQLVISNTTLPEWKL